MGAQRERLELRDLCFLAALKEAILQAMEERRLSAYRVHSQAGISQNAFQHLFRDPRSVPSVITVKRIAEALGISTERLLAFARAEAEKIRAVLEMRAKETHSTLEEALAEWYHRRVYLPFQERNKRFLRRAST